MEKSQIFEQHRTFLFAIAYRMLGSVMDAEDMVQETYLRYRADTAVVQTPKAYLATIITRLCLDQLKSARVQRESYIGEWLPEPLVTTTTPAQIIGDRDMISMAFLVLLESLTPVERAVFLLREVFDFEYAEIAAIVHKNEANCRQLFRRAKQYIVARRPRFDPPTATQTKLVNQFLSAVTTGEVGKMADLLADDVHWWSDGGGKIHAARRPIVGREAVVRFIVGLGRLLPTDIQADVVEANGQPAVRVLVEGVVYSVIVMTIRDQHITAFHAVVNPDKLRHLPS